ncbi:CU044_5270 family protein [Micromonospora coxensis]|uniref:CU044_5270 family protein n=1 Tax=Micromonospora coxensis TaxID=356852 RepID=UPI003443E27B
MSRAEDALKRLDPAWDLDRLPAAPRLDWSRVDEGTRATSRRRGWHRRTVLGAVAAGAAVVVAGVAVVQIAGPSAPVLAATPPPLSLQYAHNPPPARDALLRLATTLQSGPTGTDQGGRFSFVQVGQWSLNMASGKGGTAVAVVPQVVSTWRAPDGSGKIATVDLDSFAIDQRPDAATVIAAASHRAATVENYPVGELAAVVAEPLPRDVTALERALYAHQPRANGPKSAVRAVADLYRTNTVDRDVRVAVLQFLARTDAVLLRGTVTDRLGREGLAVSVDSDGGGTRDLLVFDRHTGWLLAYESMYLRPPEKLPVRTPAVFSYVLYLDHGRRADMS